MNNANATTTITITCDISLPTELIEIALKSGNLQQTIEDYIEFVGNGMMNAAYIDEDEVMGQIEGAE